MRHISYGLVNDVNNSRPVPNMNRSVTQRKHFIIQFHSECKQIVCKSLQSSKELRLSMMKHKPNSHRNCSSYDELMRFI